MYPPFYKITAVKTNSGVQFRPTNGNNYDRIGTYRTYYCIQIVQGLAAHHVAARMSRDKLEATTLRFEYLFC